VVSFQNIEKIKSFLTNFIDNSDKDMQVKIRDFDDYENPIDFDGYVPKEKLKSALNKYEEVIFHDGYHELMIRRPTSGEYIAFDEHGLIFIYTKENYSNALNKYGLNYKADEKLIYEFDHWHYRPANGSEDLKKMIN